MAATKGRIEGVIVTPTGGWALTMTDAGGSTPITFGDQVGQYLSDTSDNNGLLTDFEDELNANSVHTWSVTLDGGEGGTGKVTIDCDGTPFSIAWTNTDLRDALGFDANISSASSPQTGANQARALWLPDGYPVTPFDLDDFEGVEENDLHTAEAPGGTAYTIGGQSKNILEITWTGVSKAKTRIKAESITNQSFEKFRQDSIVGTPSWARAGGPIAVWLDADAGDVLGTDVHEFRVAGTQLKRFTASKLQSNPGYTLHWNIPLDRLVKLP